MATAEQLLAKNGVGPAVPVMPKSGSVDQIPVVVRKLPPTRERSPPMKPKSLEENEKEEALKQIRHQKSLGEKRWERANRAGGAAIFLAGSP